MLASTRFSSPSAWLAARRLVLLAWLGVVLASALSPWARADAPPGWERACSASGGTQWIPGPTAQPAGLPAAAHLLDCPLCLPLLAPVPQAIGPVLAVPAEQGLRLPDYAQPLVAATALPPPTRAPPLLLKS